jgi:acetyl esterase/lipase
MSKHQREAIDQMLRDGPFDLGGDVLVQRPLLEQMLTGHPLADDVRVTSGELGGVPVIFIEVGETEPRGVILHIHGGGFALGSATSSVGFASDLARKAGMSAITVDYRLAPEHPYPAALEDVTAAYEALLEREGSGAQIVLSGESAGGNLALELLIAASNADWCCPRRRCCSRR